MSSSLYGSYGKRHGNRIDKRKNSVVEEKERLMGHSLVVENPLQRSIYSGMEELESGHSSWMKEPELYKHRADRFRSVIKEYLDKIMEVMFFMPEQDSEFEDSSYVQMISLVFETIETKARQTLIPTQKADEIEIDKLVHTWKSNSILLLFWNRILFDLDFLLDVPLLRESTLHQCLVITGKLLVSAGSYQADSFELLQLHQAKVIFLDEIVVYQDRIKAFYARVARTKPKADKLRSCFTEHMSKHSRDFNIKWAMREFYTDFIRPNGSQILNSLQEQSRFDLAKKSAQQLQKIENLIAYRIECSVNSHK
ncbi:plexin b1 [Cichlidogyrus casuarinus]|uniref:Plexin b1 n=1 Tax=Cichlidogyrus casuarinus TaxID=1844966 RepID=A0ABD2QKJ3_9PLAT